MLNTTMNVSAHHAIHVANPRLTVSRRSEHSSDERLNWFFSETTHLIEDIMTEAVSGERDLEESLATVFMLRSNLLGPPREQLACSF